MNTPEDFNTWRANFGAIGTVPYRFNIGGGLDVNGQPPLNPGATTYTDHVTFDFDRVGLLFGGALDADQATFQDVTIAKNTIDTLDLRINPATGAASIRNNLAASFDMAYYEITSASVRSNSTTGPASTKPRAALRQRTTMALAGTKRAAAVTISWRNRT